MMRTWASETKGGVTWTGLRSLLHGHDAEEPRTRRGAESGHSCGPRQCDWKASLRLLTNCGPLGIFRLQRCGTLQGLESFQNSLDSRAQPSSGFGFYFGFSVYKTEAVSYLESGEALSIWTGQNHSQ